MSASSQNARRRQSYIEVAVNPIDSKLDVGEAEFQLESLTDATQISKMDLNTLISMLTEKSDNESRISLLNVQKTPYLFTSSDLLQVLAITTSIKTKITFIKMIGPRLTDPKAKSAEIIGMFRFSEEKRQVEDVLKARAQTVSTSSFSVKPAGGVLAGGGRGGGRGGRGMNGRGTGGGRGGGAAPTFTSTVPLDVIMDGIEQETPSDNLLANHSTESEIKDKISISAFQPTSIGEPLLPAPTPSAGTGGGMGGVGVPRKSRKSSIVLCASVMNSLGLGRSIENKENLDEVPLEIWEMKISPEQPPAVTSPRVSSNFHEVEFKKTVSFEEEKVSTSACDQEFKKAEDSDQVSPNQDLDLTQAEDEDPPRGQEHSLPAVTVTETCSQIDNREAEQASDAGSVNNIQPSAVETGGIRGWFARRASFISGQPLLAARPPTPPSEQVVVEETLSLDNGSTARTDEQSANAEQSKIGTNSIAGNEGDASSTVVFSKPDDAQEDESATTESVAETGTSPPSEETRSVVTVPESPQETSPTSERSPPSSPKPGFATRLLRRFSKSSPPPVATTSPQSGTTSKNQRSSLVKLQEERKVGNLLGFFEKKSNAVASGSATPPRSVSPKASSKTANASAIDEKFYYYKSLPVESCIETDPQTGAKLYSYNELVRRNYLKSYGDLKQNELEVYMTEGEFLMRFNMSKDEFKALPKWKQTDRKKTLLLF